VEPTREKAYKRRIAKLEAQLAQRDKRIAELEKEIAELKQTVHHLAEQIAKLSKNSSNSSKPPSADIVKPPKDNTSQGPRRQGGQVGHRGVNRPSFQPEQIDRIEEHHPITCDKGHCVNRRPVGDPQIHQPAELSDHPLDITAHRCYGHLCPICDEVSQRLYPQP